MLKFTLPISTALLLVVNVEAFSTAVTGYAPFSRSRLPLVPKNTVLHPRFLSVRLHSSHGPGNVQRPTNEFSRKFRPERILGGGPRQRDYTLSLEAEGKERQALAQRFELSNIDKLEADISLRREAQDHGSRVAGVEVEGTVRARVTQTCVRTSEDFDVDLEFPIFAIVRPIASVSGEFSGIDLEALEESASKSDQRNKQNVKSVRTPGNINEMDMMELQRLLQDFDIEDEVIEDEAIYTTNGVLDVGELVSQLFWLKLDPYPKKPGTGPIFTSISG